MHSQNAVAFMTALIVHSALAYLQQHNLNPALILVMTAGSLASLWATARTYRTFQWAVINQFYSAKTSGVTTQTGGQ